MERETAKSLVSAICILSLLSNYVYTTKLLDLSTYFSSYHRLDHHLPLLLSEQQNDTSSTSTTSTITAAADTATIITKHPQYDTASSSSSSSSLSSSNSNNNMQSNNNNNLQCYYNTGDDQRSSTSSSQLLPQIPSFILAGAQKAGTSALYFLLEKLPDIEPSLAFEAHFFDQRESLFKKNGKNNNNNNNTNASASSVAVSLTPQEICQARQNYLQFWDNNGTFPDGYLGFEKTPIYLCKPEIPALIQQVVPWAKIIVMLRNPIDRAYSGYRMMRERVANESQVGSFEQLVNLQVRLAREYGQSTAPLLRHYNAPSNNNNNETRRSLENAFALPDKLQPSTNVSYDRLLSRGMYARQLVNWLQYYTLNVNIKIIHYEVFAEDPSNVLNEILAFVGAKHPHKLSASVLQSAYRPTRGIKRNYTQPMLPSTREYLERFYEPYNQELVELLGEEWRDVWKKT